MGGPIIETARLTLRPPTAADLDSWARLAADAGVMRYLGGAQARSVAWREMAIIAGGWALHGFSMFSVIERATGRWVGHVGPWRPEGWPATEVGWSLAPDVWGRGYATEAAVAAMDWAVDRLGCPDIVHLINPDNAASIAVAVKLGSANRGPVQLPEPFRHERNDLWGQTAAQWRATWRSRQGPGFK